MDPLKLKEEGNEEFKAGRYENAIRLYTQAINISSNASNLFSNRALCHKRLGNYEECRKDAETAIELQETNIKAHLLCGQALLHLGKFEEDTSMIERGIRRLSRSISLCSGQQKRGFEKDLVIYLYRGKKLLWYKTQEVESKEKQELYNSIIHIENNNTRISGPEKAAKLEQLRKILFPVEQQKSIPDFMICPLSKSLMLDPVIVPPGNSYERDALMANVSSNGCYDPISKYFLYSHSFERNLIIPNTTLKRVIEEFLEKNPWAYEFSINENYRDIQF